MAVRKETKKIIKKSGNVVIFTYILLLILISGGATLLKLPKSLLLVIYVLTPYVGAELTLLIEKNHVVEDITNHNLPMVLKELKKRLAALGLLYFLLTMNHAISIIILCLYIISAKIILYRIEAAAKKKINQNK